MGVDRIPPGGQPQRSELMGRRAYRRRGHFRPHCGCFPHTMQNSVRHHWQVTVRSARFDPPQGEWKRRWCEGEWKRRWSVHRISGGAAAAAIAQVAAKGVVGRDGVKGSSKRRGTLWCEGGV